MGLFYKYQCKECGKKYLKLPVYCECGTQLSAFCPCDPYRSPNPSKNCFEIHEFAFPFCKSSKTNELEEKIIEIQKNAGTMKMERDLAFAELRKAKDENSYLIREIVQLRKFLSCRQSMTSIPNGTIEAVKYAMKKAHPDNGGETYKISIPNVDCGDGNWVRSGTLKKEDLKWTGN